MQYQAFLHACSAHEGYCTECEEFTAEMVEPDAEGRKCPVCENFTVVGAELAIIAGHITSLED